MTTDLLLSVSDLFLTMGLPSIDESLDKLLVAMESFPKSAILGDTVGYARVLGLLLALCVGSYECWMMMLGRRAMDVMKLARIIALSMCITSSSWICSELQVPGKALENTTKAMAKAKNKQVAAMELKVAQKQAEYLKRLREVQDSVETAKQIQEIGQDAHWWDKLIYSMENLGSTINKYAQQAAVAAETKVSEWINDVIRFIGELIFQMTYYGILVAQRIFMTILAMFAPVTMDFKVPVSFPLGIRDLYVPVLYRLHPALQSSGGHYRLFKAVTGAGEYMESDRRTRSSGHRFQLYVCNGYARRCLYPTLCTRGCLMAYSRWCQLQCRQCCRLSGYGWCCRWYLWRYCRQCYGSLRRCSCCRSSRKSGRERAERPRHQQQD